VRVLVTGAGGLIGSALIPALAAAGHSVIRLVRARPRAADEFRWDPESGLLDPAALADCQAVIHLAGASIAGGRWTRRRKAAIRESRVAGTRLLAGALARALPAPRVMICASAIGYYGDRGDETLDESGGPGEGFLAGVARDWEAAAEPATAAGIRVVQLRQGVVLSLLGGALPRLALPFRLGVGGPLGSGRQWMSWITLDDLVAVYGHTLARPDLAGPVNAVTPNPVTQAEVARTLGRVLGRPSWLPTPAWALRVALGEMGAELLLASQRVSPARLIATGFAFRHPGLEDALKECMDLARG
jgi:uncharacterized protein (TIGR01777 family)